MRGVVRVGEAIAVLSVALTSLTRLPTESFRVASESLFERARSTLTVLTPTNDWVLDLLHVVVVFALIFDVVAAASVAHYLLDRKKDALDTCRDSPLSRKPAIRVEERGLRVSPILDE
jgi:hypothetical protein